VLHYTHVMYVNTIIQGHRWFRFLRKEANMNTSLVMEPKANKARTEKSLQD